MPIFKKKTQINNTNYFSPDSMSVPVNFIQPQVLVEFIKNADSQIRDFIKNSKPADFNGAFYDCYTDSVSDISLADLLQQHVEHLHTVDGLDRNFKALNVKCMSRVPIVENYLQEIIKELNELNKSPREVW